MDLFHRELAKMGLLSGLRVSHGAGCQLTGCGKSGSLRGYMHPVTGIMVQPEQVSQWIRTWYRHRMGYKSSKQALDRCHPLHTLAPSSRMSLMMSLVTPTSVSNSFMLLLMYMVGQEGGEGRKKSM